MLTVLASAVGVIGNSEATLVDLARFADAEGLPCPPSIAALLGSEGLGEPPAARTDIEPPTFVTLGTIEGRKNHIMLLRVWTRLVERLGTDAPRLFIMGQRGWECDDVFELLDRSDMLRQSVKEIGRSNDATVASALAGARALLFPSFAEGYGLPLVEALRSGTPVVASDLPVFHEIAGDIPEYLPPGDDDAWTDIILDYANPDSRRRDEQLRRLKGYRPPTWRDHFEAVDPWLTAL